jgi:hypothetical protein
MLMALSWIAFIDWPKFNAGGCYDCKQCQPSTRESDVSNPLHSIGERHFIIPLGFFKKYRALFGGISKYLGSELALSSLP